MRLCAAHHLTSELGGLELLAECITFLLELGEHCLARSGGHRKQYGRRGRRGGLSSQHSQLGDLGLQGLDVANVYALALEELIEVALKLRSAL
jgi:hypothetical protein